MLCQFLKPLFGVRRKIQIRSLSLVPKSWLVLMAMITPARQAASECFMMHTIRLCQQGSNKVKGAKIELIANQDIELHEGLAINDALTANT